MLNLKYLSLLAFFLTTLIVVQSEKPCRLLISRDGTLETYRKGSNSRFVCKVTSGCFSPNHRIIGPFWKFKGKWITGFQSRLRNGTNTVKIMRISDHDFGTYQCLVKVNGQRIQTDVMLKKRIGITGDVLITMGPNITTQAPQ